MVSCCHQIISIIVCIMHCPDGKHTWQYSGFTPVSNLKQNSCRGNSGNSASYQTGSAIYKTNAFSLCAKSLTLFRKLVFWDLKHNLYVKF